MQNLIYYVSLVVDLCLLSLVEKWKVYSIQLVAVDQSAQGVSMQTHVWADTILASHASLG